MIEQVVNSEKNRLFHFINIGFNIEMREAQRMFMEERKNNRGAENLTFTQWIDIKKFEAAKFYIEKNKINKKYESKSN